MGADIKICHPPEDHVSGIKSPQDGKLGFISSRQDMSTTWHIWSKLPLVKIKYSRSYHIGSTERADSFCGNVRDIRVLNVE